MALIVAIDGPSGVGKSTVARMVAQRLGVPYLDTGAMYRALALKVLEAGVNPDDREAVARLVNDTDVGLDCRPDGVIQVLLDGVPVGERIRAPEVSEVTSKISAYPEVRQRMVALQQECAGRQGGVVEGRDIGTKVFPHTPHKLFLDARPEVRFDRRYRQLLETGQEVSFADVVEEITRRDYRDTHRADSPLTQDPSYHTLDTSDLSVEDVVERIVRLVQAAERTPPSRRPVPGRKSPNP